MRFLNCADCNVTKITNNQNKGKHVVNRVSSYFTKGGHSATQTDIFVGKQVLVLVLLQLVLCRVTAVKSILFILVQLGSVALLSSSLNTPL